MQCQKEDIFIPFIYKEYKYYQLVKSIHKNVKFRQKVLWL